MRDYHRQVKELHRWEIILARRPAYNALVGQTYRLPFGHKSFGKVVTVKLQSSSYLPEGGHKRGFELDQGWVVALAARDATEGETALFVAREAKGRAQRGEVV